MYKTIDMENWNRREYFIHYTSVVPCTYSTVVYLDISLINKYIKKSDLKLYPVLLHGLTKAVNKFEEFRYSMIDGNVVNYYKLSPSYTILNEDNTFSGIWSEYSDNLEDFVSEYESDLKEYINSGKMYPKAPKHDTFSVSMVPWLDFSAFNLNLKNDTNYLSPIFTFGKYRNKDGKTEIPLSIQVHHGVIDGYHVSQFVNALQEIYSDLSDEH